MSESIDTLPFAVTDQNKMTELISEQQNDHTLTNCMHQAKVGKGNYFFKGGALVSSRENSRPVGRTVDATTATKKTSDAFCT